MVHKKKRKQPPVESEADQEIKEEEENENSAQPTSAKRARLIVRNLPFAKLSEDVVKHLFESYGNILDVNLLKKPNGKFVGCGFVEFESRRAAAKAMAHVNGKQLNGRPVIVDWALPKHTYLEKMQPKEPEVKDEPESDEDNKDGILEYSIDTKPDGETDSEDNVEDDDSQEEDHDEDDDDFDDEMEEEEEEEEPQKKATPRKRSNDVDEGRTVFLKNVPFSANNDDVKASVADYGDVVYALVCVDKLTEHSKGTAFVKFKDKESATKCIKDSNILTINDQPVEVTKAVSRDKLDDEKKQKKLKTRDSRNLYLVREGVVMAGSPAATTVSPGDMAKRLQIEQWKTQILRNLNMFVSRTRIVVHNLPPNYDDAKLRKMIESYAPSGAVVKEARVMQDRKKFDGQGNPISKEIGFVSFINHEDALHVLRAINNNPNVFSVAKRPIVSFSIENREILNLKQKRMEKNKVKSLGDKAKDKTTLKLNKKQRRFKMRKEKIIKARQEAKLAKREGRSVEPKKKKNELQKVTPKKKEPGPAMVTHKKKVGNKPLKTPKSNQISSEQQVSENGDDFSGTVSVPGKKMKMRSKLKLKKQVEIHKNRVKELKKVKKMQKAELEKKQVRKEKELNVKTKKKKFEKDDKFSKLINTYKDRIEKATSAKKWYE